MTRPYRQGLRAQKSTETRAAILSAATELLPNADQLQVEEIARRAGVSVPTLYSHFGSKGGLLSALTAQVETEAGLFAGFHRVWESTDGEAALRMMLDATLRFWNQAWTYIEFALRVRRTDEELGGRLDRMDASRLGHLVVICRRLQEEARLRPGLTPATAGRLAFALTTPYVYEALVVNGRLPAATATAMAVDAAVDAVLRPGSRPRKKSKAPVDWARLGLKPPVI